MRCSLDEFTDLVTSGSFSLMTAVACPGMDRKDFIAGGEQGSIRKRFVIICGVHIINHNLYTEKLGQSRKQRNVGSRARPKAVTW